MSKGVQIAAGATAIALLLGWYGASNLQPGASYTYFKSLEEFQRSADRYAGQHTRVHGYVVLGSIERDVSAQEVRFRIQNEPPHAGGSAEAALGVVYSSLETPDLFKDGAEVVVEGVLPHADPDATFRADKLLAKCPSKFEAADPTRQASL